MERGLEVHQIHLLDKLQQSAAAAAQSLKVQDPKHKRTDLGGAC